VIAVEQNAQLGARSRRLPSMSCAHRHESIGANLFPKPAPRGASARLVPALSAPPDAVAWTTDGHLALIDGRTGAARQIAGAAGFASVRDLVFDPWARRIVVFEAGGPVGGELATYSLVRGPRGSLLGARLLRAWIDADASVLAAPNGIVAFERGHAGGRCALFLDDDAATRASTVAPPPASAWVSGSASGFTLHTFDVAADGSLHRRSAELRPGSMSALVDLPLTPTPEGQVTSARLVRTPARGEAISFDQTADKLAIRLVRGADSGPAHELSFGASGLRVEHAIALDGGEIVVLLVSGDSHAIAVALGPTGEITGCDALPLPGLVRAGATALSHDLCALGRGRALASTSAGVFAMTVSRVGNSVQLALDAGFEGRGLRGPLAALAEMP
jgi:hypothetical protein